jgi:hypothetical protein
MANNYKGYLLKVNGNVVPLKYILLDSWTSTPDQESEVDSYQDGDGILHRDGIMPHTRSLIEFDTIPFLRLDDKIVLQSIIHTSKESRVRMTIEYWNDNSNSYTTASVYSPPVAFPILDADANGIIYQSIHYKFIEY